jgi:hypothetical protein
MNIVSKNGFRSNPDDVSHADDRYRVTVDMSRIELMKFQQWKERQEAIENYKKEVEPEDDRDDIVKKMETWLYFLVKNAARQSYNDFLKEIDISQEEYEEIKKRLQTYYPIKFYV